MDPNDVQLRNKASVLHLACKWGMKDVAELLIKHETKLNTVDENGNTPLMEACLNGHMEIAKILLETE